jgi:O-succinylbenzoic acid--CoA ligase
MIKIHPKFKLNQKSFTDATDLLAFLQNEFLIDYEFIEELFNKKEFISVQTSGSTGNPKSIQIQKNALLKSAEATGTYFDLKSGTKALDCLSSQFIAGNMMWVRALHLGWNLALIPPVSNPMEKIEGNFDFVAMVPLQAQNSFNELHRIKKLIIGGASLSYEWEQKLANITTEVYQTYGMTETITHIAVKKNGEKVFHCLPNVSIEKDQRNCLVISLPYLNNKKIITNDLVNLKSNNSFEWLGRYDNVINSGGIKLIPELIEQKLQPFFNSEFFLAGVYDEKLGEKLILLLETAVPMEELKEIFLKANLSKFEIPKDIFVKNPFSRTENGKINRINTISILHK